MMCRVDCQQGLPRQTLRGTSEESSRKVLRAPSQSVRPRQQYRSLSLQLGLRCSGRDSGRQLPHRYSQTCAHVNAQLQWSPATIMMIVHVHLQLHRQLIVHSQYN